jgi:hypothetical protein
MNPTSQSVLQATKPVLHVTHRQRQPLAPSGTPPFSWYLCPQAGAFRHLVLLAGQQSLVHWVLPAVGPGQAEPLIGLWMQVPADLGVPLPLATEASCQGAAWAVSRATGQAATPPPIQAVQALRLLLPAPPAGTSQAYWLHPLRPGSTAWLLSQERPAGCV